VNRAVGALLAAPLLLACPPVDDTTCTPPPPDDDPLYPAAHLAPESGWMNDPSGLVFFDGRYHAFFQHNPDAARWGNLHWGHAVSDDLVRWEMLPHALFPDDELGLPYSGSAVIDRDNSSGLCARADGCLVLVFTHAGGADGAQKQSLAYSEDGETFTLYEGNPVLTKDGAIDFRDPKVIPFGDGWRMVVAAGDRAELYDSPDLIDWTYVSDIGPLEGMPDGVWEVPDLVEVDGEWVFKTDVLPGFAQQGETRYVIGELVAAGFSARTAPAVVDWGPDFYAAQSLVTPAGQPVWIGWASSWRYANDVPSEPFRGFLSWPRALRLDGDNLVQSPLDPTPGVDDCALVDGEGAEELAATFDAIEADAAVIQLRADGVGELELVVRGDGGDEGTVIRWSGGPLEVDRTASGDTLFNAAFPAVFSMPLPTDTFTLDVIVDLYSVEVFAEGRAITTTIFPRPSSRSMSLTTSGAVSATVRRFTRP
jgi:fructan beta-fructosidase